MSTINQISCQACGLCAEVCPYRIFKKGADGKYTFDATRSSICVQCGHCMAICPTESVQIANLNYQKDFYPLSGNGCQADDFFSFLQSRRSIRYFQDKPVPRELLSKIVETISSAPMGLPPHNVEITVVQDKRVIEQALPILVKFYADLQKFMGNPLSRFLIKRLMPLEDYNSLLNRVMPAMKINIPLMEDHSEDFITRGAPAMLIFHAHRGAENHSVNAVIDLTYGLLAAHAMGLGATAIGLVPPAVERNKELRSLFKIPAENHVLASMIVGYPKYAFKRGIRHELKNVTWI